MGLVRRSVPLVLMPLCIVAGVLAATPWLHSFPGSAIGVPVFGAAAISVLVPAVAVRLGAGRLWQSLAVDVVCFVVYTLLIVLHDPLAFGALAGGLYHGPSQILTFALPLVSPRSLFVAPVALAWLVGALAGECLTRRWFTILPFPGFLLAYGLAYAATVRATNFTTTGERVHQSVIAGLLLVTLLLLRAAQAWVRQDETAESTQADGILPLRGLGVGGVTAVVVALVAAVSVQSPAFSSRSTAPQRVPSVHDSRPLSPVAFISSLRPSDPRSAGTPVFTVQTDRKVPGYFAIANADDYDGAGWSFTRTFRPSGGVLPRDSDPELLAPSRSVRQTYRIDKGPLVGAPWMPYLYRPQKVTGTAINIDPDSGMIVPAGSLRAGQQYQVSSQLTSTPFATLPPGAAVATGTASNGGLPDALDATLTELAKAFSSETGTSLSPAIPFLQALEADLRANYSLSGAPGSSSSSSSSPSSSAQHVVEVAPGAARTTPANDRGKRRASTPPTTPTTTTPTTAAPSVSASPGARAGSAAFADVLASVVGPDRTGTPEQYATLVALLARHLGVPARVVSGFRVSGANGSAMLPPGEYHVTTAEAWTWAEVPVTGVGWVILDAAPSTYSNARQRPTTAASPSPTPTATPSQNALMTKSNGGHAIAPQSKLPGSHGSSVEAALITLLIAVGAVVLALLALVVVRKQVRRYRRQRLPDPRSRAVAAWQESIDVLTEAGLPEPAALTTAEIAELTERRFGPNPAAQAEQVGGTAAAAGYSTTLLITPEQADAAWTAERTLRRQVNGQLSVGARLVAWLRYHRTRPIDPPAGPASWADEVERRVEARRARGQGWAGRWADRQADRQADRRPPQRGGAHRRH